MLRRMPAAELAQWEAFEQVTGPLGRDRDDVLATMVAFYVVSALGSKNVSVEQLLPNWDRQPTDWRQMREFFKALTVASGGDVEGGDR